MTAGRSGTREESQCARSRKNFLLLEIGDVLRRFPKTIGHKQPRARDKNPERTEEHHPLAHPKKVRAGPRRAGHRRQKNRGIELTEHRQMHPGQPRKDRQRSENENHRDRTGHRRSPAKNNRTHQQPEQRQNAGPKRFLLRLEPPIDRVRGGDAAGNVAQTGAPQVALEKAGRTAQREHDRHGGNRQPARHQPGKRARA